MFLELIFKYKQNNFKPKIAFTFLQKLILFEKSQQDSQPHRKELISTHRNRVHLVAFCFGVHSVKNADLLTSRSK